MGLQCFSLISLLTFDYSNYIKCDVKQFVKGTGLKICQLMSTFCTTSCYVLSLDHQ